MTTKIAVYGFGSMPVVQRHLMDMARAESRDLAWCAILTQPHYRQIMRDVLPPADILDVFDALPREPVGGDLSLLAGYVGSLAEDMAARKRQWRPRSGDWLLRRGIDYYKLYKAFLSSTGATHLLTSNIETPDGKIVIAAARELGLGVLSPVDLRNLTGTMFASDAAETPPAYARVTPETRAEALTFVKQFREKWTPARGAPREIDPETDDCTMLAQYLPRMPQRLAGFARVAYERPDLFDPVYVRNAVMSNSRLLQRLIWDTRERQNRPLFHVADAASLPKHFVFYPLQFTPEASINTPAPYFVEQLRVIDALRFAMPSDHLLVVKEHWSCLPLRPASFMRQVMRLPGVVVASSGMSAREIIDRAAVTVSVTGTATFEAFIAGQPAIALGPGLAAWSLGGPTGIGELRGRLRERIGNPHPDSVVVDRIATLLSVRHAVFWGTPHMPGEPMLRRGNMQRLLSAILDHVALAQPSTRHAASTAT